MGSLCVDPERVGEAVRIGDESAVAALESVVAERRDLDPA
jgi:hypothetical protein